jgi:parallel beta-helix repeat protein
MVEGAGTDGIEFIDCHAFNNTQSGFSLIAGKNITLIGCQASGNGASGCAVASGMDGFTLIGNTFGATAGFPGNVHGISFAGTADRCVISGNRLIGNTTDAMNAAPSGNITLSGNIGYVSKATGVVSFPAASTSVAVTHGLSAPPPASNILLTMNSGMGTAVSVWVSATGPTTFTITSGAAPGATMAIAWQASLVGA